MSRPSSGKKGMNFSKISNTKSQGNLIILQKERLGSAKSKKSVMIVDKGKYKIQYNIDSNNINKEKIDKTVKNLEKQVLSISKKYNNTNININTNNNEIKELNILRIKTNNSIDNDNNNKNNSEKYESNKALINSESSNREEKEKSREINKKIIIDNKKTTETEDEKTINVKLINQNNENESNETINEYIDKNINEYNNEYIEYNNDYNEYKYYDTEENFNETEKRFRIYHTNSFNEDNLIEETLMGCLICDRTYPLYKLYSSQCNKHYICRRCFKNYYEEKIEQGEKILKCPVYKCEKNINLNKTILQKILSSNHIDLLYNNNNNLKESEIGKTVKNKKNNINEPSLSLQKKFNLYNQYSETMKKYMNKHVIDINSNQNFYMYNKAKVQFCPKCFEQTLFSKTGTYFVKCLNCFHRICKYCMKEFNEFHMDMNYEEHCKVYFRRDEKIEEEEKNFFSPFLIELFFVISAFLFLIFGSFMFFFNLGKKIFREKYLENLGFFKRIFLFFFTFILFFCSLPFLIIILPYFPILNLIFGF